MKKWSVFFTSLLPLGVTLCVSGCVTSHEEQLEAWRAEGARNAKAAIERGELSLKEYPPAPSPPAFNEYTKLLKERIGVDYEVISAPEFSEKIVQGVYGWNDTMREEIKSKEGQMIFDELMNEAKRIYQQSLDSQNDAPANGEADQTGEASSGNGSKPPQP